MLLTPDALRAIADPVARSSAVADAYEQAEERLAEIRLVRDATVLDLRRAGWGYDRIAGTLRMTKARVQQIARAAERP